MSLPVTLVAQLADRTIIVTGLFIDRHRLYGTTRLASGFLYTMSLLPLELREAGSASFTSGSFAYDHFKLYNINSDLFFTFWAEEWKFHQNCICIYFGSCFSITNRATHPKGIISIIFHFQTSDYGFALRSATGFSTILFAFLFCY